MALILKDRFRALFKPYNLALLFLFLIFNAQSMYLIQMRSSVNSNFLPILHFAKNPAAFQNDIMYQCTQFLFTLYYIIPGLLAHYLSNDVIIYATLLLQNSLIFICLYWLAQELFDDRLTSVLSIIIVVFYGVTRFSLGSDVVFGANLFPGLFAIPLLLLAISFFLEDRFLLAGLITGLMFNFHGSHSLFVIVMFSVYFLFNFRSVGLVTIVKSLCLFALGALPLVLIILLSRQPATGQLPFKEWLIHMYIRRGHHCFPSMFVIKAKLFFTLTMLPIVFSYIFNDRLETEKRKKLFYLAGGVLLLFVIGTVFTELIPVAPIINLTLFRSSRFLVLVGIIIFADYFARVYQGENQAASLAVLLIVFTFFSQNQFILMVPALIYLVFYELNRKFKWLTEKKYYHWLILFLLVAVFETGVILLKDLFPVLTLLQRNPTGLYLALLSMALFFASDSVKVFLPYKNQFKAVFLILFLVVSVLYVSYPRPPLAYDPSWLEVQRWINLNAPADKLVITPPYKRGFRSYGGRGIILTWFDSDDMAYVPHLGQEIMSRLKDLGFSYRNLKSASWYTCLRLLQNSYNRFNENYFRYLAGKYDCGLLIVERSKTLAFPMLYFNDDYAVYLVR